MSAGRSPEELMNAAEGQSLDTIIKRGLAAWILSIWGSLITGTQWLFELAIAPIRLLVDFMDASIQAFLFEPLSIVVTGSQTTEESIATYGIAALFVGGGIVLLWYLIVIRYIGERETTDVPIPGLGFDVIPFAGVDEEANEDE